MTRGILTDVTACIGCQQCVAGCQRANGTAAEAPFRWQPRVGDLSADRLTTVVQGRAGRFVRFHCRHCLDPACAAACPVGAMSRAADGAVTYDSSICMGCRYCMLACPFRIPRYEWASVAPRVRKCVLCHERIERGELQQPACTASCPAGATVYGERSDLLREAHRRIRSSSAYIDHVWGEHDVGGTAVLYVSDVDLADAGWPEGLGDDPRPVLARRAVATAPVAFGGAVAFMFGLHWTFERRKAVAAARAEGRDAPAGAARDEDDGGRR